MHAKQRLSIQVSVILFLLFVAMMPVTAQAESGTLADCLLGCIPGDNACTECCKETFTPPADVACFNAYVTCSGVCESEAGTRAVSCFKGCRDNLKTCVDKLGADVKTFECPDWVRPLDCPFECQAWNPRTRECVGAPRSSCD